MATATWTNLKPAGDVPVARHWHGMVYESRTGKLILFGGVELGPMALQGSLNCLNDTWAYDPIANTRAELNPTGNVPDGRFGFAMAYAEVDGKVILFGGTDGQGVNLNGTWAYDPAANTWTELRPTGIVPAARQGSSMVYDPTSSKVILFGGFTFDSESNSIPFNDTWAYDPAANTWTELKPAGDVPAARSSQAMVYSSATSNIILFGGDADGVMDDTWAYDPAANTWGDLNPAGKVPPARFDYPMAYDASSGRVIIFGGKAYPPFKAFNDTWTYDPAANTWTPLIPTGDVPFERGSSCAVYDPKTGKMILFGGSGAVYTGDEPGPNDTWALGVNR